VDALFDLEKNLRPLEERLLLFDDSDKRFSLSFFLMADAITSVILFSSSLLSLLFLLFFHLLFSLYDLETRKTELNEKQRNENDDGRNNKSWDRTLTAPRD